MGSATTKTSQGLGNRDLQSASTKGLKTPKSRCSTVAL